MPTVWVRKGVEESSTTALSLVSNTSIYQNSRSVAGNITLVQKVTVVSHYLWGITDTEDTWSMTLLVTDEAVTPTYGAPEEDDPEVKGHYIFARGPVLYQPKRLIEIPVESELTVRINKELGGNPSEFRWHVGFLLQTTL